MEKEKSYILETVIIVLFLVIIFMYFVPINFLKFITWLGKT